jgi:hypothetical protein
VTRTIALGVALIGLAALNQPAAANSCLPQHHAYVHSAHYERATRIRRHEQYVVVDRPRYRTVYEEVYEPVPVTAPYPAPYWRDGPYGRDWGYDDGPMWHADYFGAW